MTAFGSLIGRLRFCAWNIATLNHRAEMVNFSAYTTLNIRAIYRDDRI